MNKESAAIAKQIIRNPYAWPGGYPTFGITNDGGALCPTCCKSEFRLIATSTGNDGWTLQAQDINWADTMLFCDHCNELIESAYGGDNE